MSAGKRAAYWLVILVIFVIMVWLLRSILLPFVVGAAVAYFLDPPTDKLEARGLSRTLSTSIIIIVFFILIIIGTFLFIPILYSQISGIFDRLPHYVVSLRGSVLPSVVELAGTIGIDLSSSTGIALKEIATDTVGLGFKLLHQVWSGGLAVFNIIGLFIITPVVAFYLLRDFNRMTSTMDEWLPRQYAMTIRSLLMQIDTVMAGFIRGQGTVCLVLAIFYALSLTFVGLEFGLIIGLLSGLVSFIPFIGASLGLVLSMLTALTQFLPAGEYIPIAMVAAVFIFGQIAESQYLTPRLLGDRIGLHPIWVMFSLMAGGALFGLLGVLIAVPAAAAIGVIIRFALTQYLHSRLYLGQDRLGGDDTSK